MYCKLVREQNPPPQIHRELSGYGKAINFNGLWKPNYLLHAHPSPCFPSLLLLPFRNRSLTLLSIREPIASPGNDACEPSRTRFLPPIPGPNPPLFTLNRPTDIPHFDVIAHILRSAKNERQFSKVLDKHLWFSLESWQHLKWNYIGVNRNFYLSSTYYLNVYLS